MFEISTGVLVRGAMDKVSCPWLGEMMCVGDDGESDPVADVSRFGAFWILLSDSFENKSLLTMGEVKRYP